MKNKFLVCKYISYRWSILREGEREREREREREGGRESEGERDGVTYSVYLYYTRKSE